MNMVRKMSAMKRNAVISVLLSCFVLGIFLFSGAFYANAETEDWNMVSSGGGWYETEGVLNPTASNEVAQYKTKLTGNFKLELEISLVKDSNATTAFQVALFANKNSPDMQYAYSILLDTINDYVVVSNNAEYAGLLIGEKGYSDKLRDGIAKTLTIISYDQKLYVSYDGTPVVAGYEMEVTSGYLNISAADIRDGVLSAVLSEDYTPSEAEINTSAAINETDTYIDFTGTDGGNVPGFQGGYQKWMISGNTFKPNMAFATTLFDKGVNYAEEKSIREISFKFKMDGEFHFGFVKNVTNANQDGALMAHIKSTSISFANATGGTMETYRTVNTTLDATTEHEAKIITRDGKAAFYIDGTYLYSHVLPVDANLILFQSNGANGYIDDFSISKEESENQIYLDFETTDEAGQVKTLYAGWSLDGTTSQIKPGAQWAAAYIQLHNITY